jgi:hypothetical protein
MADQEIAKHGKNMIRLFASKRHSVAEKLREMALEIVTIVFAVSLSIWLHGLSEHYHEQQQTRSFLLGLNADLKRDIRTLTEIAAFDRSFDQNYRYLAGLDAGQTPDPKKFDPAYRLAWANIYFTPQRSRYEGFKSSGKLTNIENEKLLNDILTLYEILQPQIGNSEHASKAKQELLTNYLDTEVDSGDDTAQRYKLIVAPKGKRILKRMPAEPQLYERYADYAALAKRIVGAIDKLYPEGTAQ